MTEKQLSVAGALTLRLLKEHPSPIVTAYDLAVGILKLYLAREYAGQKIKKLSSPLPERGSISKYRNALMELGILEERRGLPVDTYILPSSPFQDDMNLACGIDPFCYVSHLSAMAYHGLTDRFSKTLFVTTLPPTSWRKRAEEKMQRDLGDALEQFRAIHFPTLTRHTLSAIGRQPVNTHVSKYADAGAYVHLADRPARVSSIGRTFLDMLRQSDLCGGMIHVVRVFETNARTYLPLLLDEIDRHGRPIDKVRAGYILDERCGIHDLRIEQWHTFAQRGGSRVLDAGAPFWPEFSEKWCLSINVNL
ncbi:type IV toxin-antitoxin system AbiEi family antitoxin domain-containing protein [Pandoraea apista]|uniref:type IV toxin-antitoxin system AbiEi family antitoxin domain-containing protein n=1 Tax=Pandoraea apista TaxID=93218 RepID=UPI000F65CF68|nr:hypothetical protein [Pandoraea apista]RRW88473.1 hypothetical protein EGJ54_24745 [Pandoraea apista]RRW96838.1 hypothetical protein EGJ56_24725 [Pandoraea apista]